MKSHLDIARFRPTSLDEFCGNAYAKRKVAELLGGQHERDHVLISGPPRSGMTTVARILSSGRGCCEDERALVGGCPAVDPDGLERDSWCRRCRACRPWESIDWVMDHQMDHAPKRSRCWLPTELYARSAGHEVTWGFAPASSVELVDVFVDNAHLLKASTIDCELGEAIDEHNIACATYRRLVVVTDSPELLSERLKEMLTLQVKLQHPTKDEFLAYFERRLQQWSIGLDHPGLLRELGQLVRYSVSDAQRVVAIAATRSSRLLRAEDVDNFYPSTSSPHRNLFDAARAS
jgi:hypothetical protein